MVETNDATREKEAETRARWFWVGLIVLLLGGQVLLLLVMTYIATSDASFAIEPDYYQKGLNWDKTAAQVRRNEELGWQLQLSLADEASVLDERVLQCALVDRDGNALEGAVIDLIAFPHVRGRERAEVTLLPGDSGGYEATLRFDRPGIWEFRFVVQRGGETFTWTETRYVSPPGESRPWRP